MAGVMDLLEQSSLYSEFMEPVFCHYVFSDSEAMTPSEYRLSVFLNNIRYN